tara:strand:+ start:286 stop:651 length:366 start_codon:yes stop_codon:yes gene_type:complete
MLNFLLPILKNPLARLIGQKVIGGIQNKIETDKIIKAREIEAAKTVSIEQIRQQEHSIKDEILTILISGILICTFLPLTQPSMMKGFEILKSAPTEFWWAVLIVFSGSFGMSTLKNIKKKK